MIDMKDFQYTPSIEEICEYVNNPLLYDFCGRMKRDFRAACKIEFSKCSWEYGWNVKFKKSGKSLCTIYPRECYFTVLVVIGTKEKEKAEEILPKLASELQEIYYQTQEGNGKRWLMIDLEDVGEVYDGVWKFIELRRM